MYLRGTYFGCNLFIVFENNFVIISINGITTIYFHRIDNPAKIGRRKLA